MKRIAAILLIVGSLLVGSGRVAFAEPSFNPDPHSAGSCGMGPEVSAVLRADPTRPGASEAVLFPAVGVCTGN